MKTLRLTGTLAGLMLFGLTLSTPASAGSGQVILEGPPCTGPLDPRCFLCPIVDTAEGSLTSPPSGSDGAIPIAPIPHSDLETATWIVVCIG